MGNGGEPVRTSEKLGDIGGSKGGTDSDCYEKEKAGMVRARQGEEMKQNTSEQLWN